LTVALLVAVSVVSAAPPAEPKPRKEAASGTVVFVCEHGNVKSLMAREWFNRLAEERGLLLRAVSRGLTPANPVPPAIADALRRDGFDVTGFEARALTPEDLVGAARVVAIGVDTSAVTGRGEVPLDTWEGIPPATQSYEASRDALRARIQALLATLEAPGARR